MNHGKDIFTVRPGDRIGQLVLNKVEQIEWNVVPELDMTERGAGGFGSTGQQ
jgi:dUTP pyrophosphatase